MRRLDQLIGEKHRRSLWRAASALSLLGFAAGVAAQAPLQFADLGTCELESGAAIRDCRVGYRTFGRLNAERSNAVLFPTALWNTTEGVEQLFGPQGLLDTSDWFVIAVDAFGNGVSSSPSNSPSQGGDAFPRFSIRDMVNSQYRLVTEVLGLERLHAVTGISMGGIQTFEWMVAYPSMLRKAIPMVGTPRPSSYDLFLWGTVLDMISQCEKAGCANTGALAWKIANLGIVTPQERMATTPRDGLDGFVSGLEEQARATFVADDAMSQVRAILDNDVAKSFGGSMGAAAAIRRFLFRGCLEDSTQSNGEAIAEDSTSCQLPHEAGIRTPQPDRRGRCPSPRAMMRLCAPRPGSPVA